MSIPADPTPESGAVRAQQTVDAQGVLCPVPIIRLARAATALPPGSVLELLTDDPAAAHDVPAWCHLRGHELLSTTALATPGLGTGGPETSGLDTSGLGGAGLGAAHERADPAASPEPGASATRGPEPHAPNPAPGQVLRHLIRLAGPVSSAAVPG